jgi:hypothetical protein
MRINGRTLGKVKTATAVLLLVLLGVCAVGAFVAHQESAEKQTKKEGEPNKPGGV